MCPYWQTMRSLTACGLPACSKDVPYWQTMRSLTACGLPACSKDVSYWQTMRCLTAYGLPGRSLTRLLYHIIFNFYRLRAVCRGAVWLGCCIKSYLISIDCVRPWPYIRLRKCAQAFRETDGSHSMRDPVNMEYEWTLPVSSWWWDS